MKNIIISFVFAITFHHACSQTLRDTEILLDSLTRLERFSGEVLLADQGRITWEQSFGLSDREISMPINHQTIFESASITKQFIALSVLQLRDKGLLSLEDPLDKFFTMPCLKGIRIKHLLSHTSGLTDYEKLINEYRDKSKVHFNQDVISFFSALSPPLDFLPGERMEYSNTGYIFLAQLIEKVSGQNLHRYLSSKIFKPLKMKHTFAFNTRRATGKLPRNYAKGYVYDKRYNKLSLPDTVPNTRYVITFDGMLGDGNVSTTARDLLLWDQGLYSSKLISRRSLTEMNTPFVLNSGEKGTIPGVEQHYGYGVFISQDKKYGKIISHGGSWPGYSTFLFRAVDQNKTFIILSNLSLPYLTEQSIINKLKSEIFKK